MTISTQYYTHKARMETCPDHSKTIATYTLAQITSHPVGHVSSVRHMHGLTHTSLATHGRRLCMRHEVSHKGAMQSHDSCHKYPHLALHNSCYLYGLVSQHLTSSMGLANGLPSLKLHELHYVLEPAIPN